MSVSENDLIYFLISKEAYKDQQKRDPFIMDYQYAPEYSSRDIATYINNDMAIVGCAGTKYIWDIKTDLYLLLNKLEKTDRFRNDYLLVTSIPFRKEFCGHSLGAGLSIAFANLLQTKAVVFNPPILPKKYEPNPNIKIYSRIGDITSLLAFTTPYNTTFSKPTAPLDDFVANHDLKAFGDKEL